MGTMKAGEVPGKLAVLRLIVLPFRAQEIQEEAANEARANLVTVAKHLYMGGVTNVARARLACARSVCFGARSAPIKHGTVSRSARHVKKMSNIYKRGAECGSAIGAVDKRDIS